MLWRSVEAADQAALAGVFRRVQFGQLVGSGHFPQIEVPAQLDAMIERFVATLSRRRGAFDRSKPSCATHSHPSTGGTP